MLRQPPIAHGRAALCAQALTRVAGLQKKHSMLVPKKLDEKSFWVNFFMHMTAVISD
jgi:hypothetical protein